MKLELYNWYIEQGFAPIKCRGYNLSVPQSENNPRKNAKIAITKNYTSETFKILTYKECCDWIRLDGWLGWRVHKNIIALDVDKDNNKNIQIEKYLKDNNCTYAIHNTREGKHYFLRTDKEITSNSTCITKLGIEITLKPGMKSYLILEPMEKGERFWDKRISFKDLSIIPDLFLQLNLHNSSEIVDAIISQIKYYYKQGILNGYDVIDMPFGGWLIDSLNVSEEQYCVYFSEIFGKDYDEVRTKQSYINIKNKKDYQSTGTLIKKLQEFNLLHIVKLISLLDLGDKTNQITKIIDEFNKEYSVVDLGGAIKIMREMTSTKKNVTDRIFYSVADFRLKFKYKEYTYHTKDGKKVTVETAVLWFKHQLARRYDQVVFVPGSSHSDNNIYNLWEGYAFDANKGKCDLYLNHIKNIICDNNEEYYEYLLDWMAHVVQFPNIKNGVAVALYGNQGTGKGVFVSNFCKLFGNHYLYMGRPDALTSNFNSQLMNKCVVFADEAFWGGDKNISGILKSMITEDTLRIEYKGQEAFNVNNYIHLIIASNNERTVPAEISERRFFCLKVSDKEMQNNSYFNNILQELEEGGYEALLYFLLNRDISQKNVRKIPKTDALFQQQSNNLTTSEEFILELLNTGDFSIFESSVNSMIGLKEWPKCITSNDLHKIYHLWCKLYNKKYVLSIVKFGKEIINILKLDRKVVKIDNKTHKAWIIPKLDVCKAQLKKYMKNDNIFDTIEEIDEEIENINTDEGAIL